MVLPDYLFCPFPALFLIPNSRYFNPAPDDEDDLAAEYTFDYSKARPNRFAAQNSSSKMTVIVLDKDIAQAFPTSEAVNQALRQLIETKR